MDVTRLDGSRNCFVMQIILEDTDSCVPMQIMKSA